MTDIDFDSFETGDEKQSNKKHRYFDQETGAHFNY